MAEYEFHELADIFPLMEGKPFDELVADIKENGLREPIVVLNEKILDGRNRYRACLAADVDPRFEHYHGDDPVRYIISLNLRRRHLDESQRAMVAAKLANLGEGRPSNTAPIGAVSQSDAADLLNVGRRSVQRATAVQEHGVPELQRAVEAGGVSVAAAAYVASRPESEQREIVARGEKEILKAAAAIRKKKAADRRLEIVKRKAAAADCECDAIADARVIIRDIRHLTPADILNESVDAIVTDPPYAQEYIDLFDELGALAARVLKPGGALLCLCGQYHLPDYIRLLSRHLDYQWTLGVHTSGNVTQIFPRRIVPFWKPILLFSKGPRVGDWISDFWRADVTNDGKAHHEWGQSEQLMQGMVERVSLPGETVLDPFSGGGTTGVVCQKLKRKFIGVEIDEATAKAAQLRMAGALN